MAGWDARTPASSGQRASCLLTGALLPTHAGRGAVLTPAAGRAGAGVAIREIAALSVRSTGRGAVAEGPDADVPRGTRVVSVALARLERRTGSDAVGAARAARRRAGLAEATRVASVAVVVPAPRGAGARGEDAEAAPTVLVARAARGSGPGARVGGRGRRRARRRGGPGSAGPRLHDGGASAPGQHEGDEVDREVISHDVFSGARAARATLAFFTRATVALRTSSVVASGASKASRAAFGPLSVVMARSKP